MVFFQWKQKRIVSTRSGREEMTEEGLWSERFEQEIKMLIIANTEMESTSHLKLDIFEKYRNHLSPANHPDCEV